MSFGILVEELGGWQEAEEKEDIARSKREAGQGHMGIDFEDVIQEAAAEYGNNLDMRKKRS